MFSTATHVGLASTGEDAGDRIWGVRGWVWLWAIVVVGAVLRLIALGHKSFWIDEIASLAIAQKPSAAFWHFLWHDEGNMALYYGLLRPWLHFGKSEAIIRSLSVIPGVLSIPLSYLLGRRLFQARTGLLAAALFALNPCAIASSQEARAYSFVVLAVMISSYCFICLIEKPSYRWAISYGMCAGLTCYFHYFGVLIPLAHAISMMALPRDRRRWKQYSVAAVLFVLLTMPVLWLMHAQDVGHIAWVQRPSLLEFYHLGVFLAAHGGKAVGAVLLALDLLLVGVFLVKLRAVWVERANDLQRWHYSLVASGFFSPIVMVLAASIIRPAFYHRFLIICLPWFIMMTAVGAQQISRRTWQNAALVGVAGLSLVSTVIVYTRVTEDWRGAIGYLVGKTRGDDRVLYYQPVGYFAGQNYWDWLTTGSEPHAVGVAVDPQGAEWEQKIDRAPRVWLVLYRAQVDDKEAGFIQQQLQRQYDAGEHKVFRGVTILQYVLKSKER